jgi:hypothetical protein
MGELKGEIKPLPHSIEYIGKAMSVERLGGASFFNMCGMGETLLAPYVVELAEQFISQGHCVHIVTNGTLTGRIKELCTLSAETRQNLSVLMSLHYLELKQKKILDCFFDNFRLLKNAGISVMTTLATSDDLIEHIDEIKEVCINEIRALPNVTISRDASKQFDNPILSALDRDEFYKTWKTFDSKLFEAQYSYLGVKRKEFCYAGEWIFNFLLENGNLFACPSGVGNPLTNVYDDVSAPVRLAALGTNCPFSYCYCGHCYVSFGAIPSLPYPYSYTEMYNRVCNDGSEFITSKRKAFLDSGLIESNTEYSENKKTYINTLMAIEYNYMENKHDKNELARILEKHLTSYGWHSVAIFGKDRFCEWLLEILACTDIRVKFTVDHTLLEDPVVPFRGLKDRLRRFLKYWYKRIVRHDAEPIPLRIFDRWPKVDAIIVTPYAKYDFLEKKIEGKTKARIVSITQLVN